MLSNAVALAILTTGGCILIYRKLPRKVRKLIEKHDLMTDLFTLVAVYMLLGGTLTALVAAAMCGIFISILLKIVNDPDQYLYLYDLRDFIKSKLDDLKETLNSYGVEYRERQEDKTINANLYEMPMP